MQYIINLIEEGSWCSLLFVAAVLACIGHSMVQSRPTVRLWGERFAAVSFFVFAGIRALLYGEPATEDLVAAVFYGVLAGAILLGPAWIILTVVSYLHGCWIGMQQAAKQRYEERTRRSEKKSRQQELEQQLEYEERLAPMRERAAQEAAQRQLIRDQQRRAESERREDARVACDLLYALREPDIGDRYSRERFEEFVSKYLGDSKPIDVFERRAAELQQLIQQHYQAVNPPEKFRNLAELTTWYEEQLTLVENLSIADVYKRDYRAQLNERYSELTDRLLESLEP